MMDYDFHLSLGNRTHNGAHGASELPAGETYEMEPSEKAKPMFRCQDLQPLTGATLALEECMIRKLKSGEYRLYSRKINPKSGKRRNLGTFPTREAAEKHERAVQYFKRAG